MKELVFDSKKAFTEFCKNEVTNIQNLFKDSICCIESYGAIVKIQYRYFCGGKYNAFIVPDKINALMICIFIYPKGYSEQSAEEAHLCQCYHSKFGVIRLSGSTFRLRANEREDRGMKQFFNRYIKRLERTPMKDALKDRISDIMLNAIRIKRIGSFYGKPFRQNILYGILILALLIFLFILRVLTPSGYHPSLK